MSSISSGNFSQIAGSYADTAAVYSKSETTKTDETSGKKKVSGQTIGNPQLSERMASDENYRKQYEGIIANAASGISQLASSLSATGTSVKGFGMQVNDNGTASYFAVLEKSSAAQKERIEKKAVEKKEAKKTAQKKAEKKKNEERLEKKRKETGDVDDTDDAETVTVTASSIEELLEKIKDQEQLFLSDTVKTPQEKNVGQNVDFSV